MLRFMELQDVRHFNLHLNDGANIEFHQKPWAILFIIESIY